jgi:hypothetical protein
MKESRVRVLGKKQNVIEVMENKILYKIKMLHIQISEILFLTFSIHPCLHCSFLSIVNSCTLLGFLMLEKVIGKGCVVLG